MAVADGQRAVDAHAEDPNCGERRLSLTEGLVLCLVSEGPTYGLILARLLAPDGSLGQIWSVPKGVVYYTLQQLELLGLMYVLAPLRNAATAAGVLIPNCRPLWLVALNQTNPSSPYWWMPENKSAIFAD